MDPPPQQKREFLDFQMMLMVAGLARGGLRSLLWPPLPTPFFLFSHLETMVKTVDSHRVTCGEIPTKDTRRSASLSLSSSPNPLSVPAADTRNTPSSPSLLNNAGVPGKGGALSSAPHPSDNLWLSIFAFFTTFAEYLLHRRLEQGMP